MVYLYTVLEKKAQQISRSLAMASPLIASSDAAGGASFDAFCEEYDES